MKKRLLLLSLAIAAAITSISGTFAYADSEVKYSDFSDTYGLIGALVEDNTLPEKEDEPVTRAQFVYTLMSLIGQENSGNDVTNYSDVARNNFAAKSIDYAETLGIIAPGIKFYPNDVITYNEAVKMSLSLAGYSKMAENEGGYPNGYLRIAGEKRINAGMSSSEMTSKNTAVLLYNVMNMDLLDTTYSKGNMKINKEENLLSRYRNVYSVKGIVDSNENSGLWNKEAYAPKGMISIDGERYFADGMQEMLGYNVEAYYSEDKETKDKTVIFASKSKNDVIEIDAQDVDSFKDNTLTYRKDSKTRKYKLKNNYGFIWNGKALYDADMAQYFEPETGSVKLIDNDRDGKYDVAVVENVTYCYISRLDTIGMKIYDKNIPECIDLSDDVCYNIYDVAENYKEEISFYDLSESSLVACIVSADKKAVKIEVCNYYIEGTASKIDTTDNKNKIGDKEYNLSEYAKKYCKNLSSGSNGIFYIGLNNDVVVYEPDASQLKYAWLIKVYDNDDDTYTLKMLTQDSKIERITLADRVKFDMTTVKDSDQIKSRVKSIENSADTMRLIKYAVNKEGKINCVDTVSEATDVSAFTKKENEKDSLTLFYNEDCMYKSGPSTFSPRFNIAGMSYNFVIPDAKSRSNDNMYKIVNNRYYSNDSWYKVAAYDLTADGTAKATLYVSSSNVTSVSIDNPGAVIQKISESINSDDESVYKLELWVNGVFKSLCTNTESARDIAATLSPGDIIRYETNTNGEIIGIEQDYSIKKSSVIKGSTSHNNKLEYVCGSLFSYNGGYANIVPNLTPDGRKLENIRNLKLGTLIFIEYGKADGVIHNVNIYSQPESSIKDYMSAGYDADYVVSRQRWAEPVTTYVYREVK